MNAIHDKYADRGLVVLGVSREPGKRLASWAERRSAKYPVVSAPQGPTKYGVCAYPTYYLVSAAGKVLAGPQHRKFSKNQIESALKAVVQFPAIPETGKLKPLAKAAAAKKMVNIARALTQLEQAKDLDKVERAAVRDMRRAFSARTKIVASEVESLGNGPDYYLARERLKELGKIYKGLPVERDVKAQLARFQKDKTIKRELTAASQLAGFRKRYPINKYSGRKKLTKALVGLIKKYPETNASTRAQALLARVRRMR